MEVAADTIAAHVHPLLGRYEPVNYMTTAWNDRTPGDLVHLLGLPTGSTVIPPDELKMRAVQRGDQPATAGDEAPVLILGDSFVAVYNEGPTAGLPAHLMLRLGAGVQFIGGPNTSPLENQQRLAEEPDSLRKKKVVILEFVTRGLAAKYIRWEKVPLPPSVARVTEPTDLRGVDGSLDLVDAETITGWAWAGSHPDHSVDVEIYDGDALLATVTADLFREDLRDAKIGKGFHAFRLSTPRALKDGKVHTIRAKVAGTQFELFGSPKMLGP
jgi:hypothetical protein